MTTRDHDVTRRLVALDPVLGDPAPAPGSPRYLSILERAVTSSELETSTPSLVPSSGRRRRRRWGSIVAAVAVAAAIVVVLVVVRPFSSTPVASAAERVARAADNTAEVATFRVHGEYREVGTTLAAEVSGADVRMVFTGTDPTSGESADSIFTVIGDRQWQTVDGKTTEEPAPGPEGRNAPFQQASRAVIRAALSGGSVVEVGTEAVRGVTTTRYRITLDAVSIKALAALAPNELSAFELEYPNEVATIDLWIADDLIRRIHVVGNTDQYEVPGSPGDYQPLDSIIEFYDFGAPITIRPPA